MYADRVEAGGGKRSIKERLNGNSINDSTRRRFITGKRLQREDDKWEHDLYDDVDGAQVSYRKAGTRDLRFKLQRKGPASQIGKGPVTGVRDLREKLSGTMNSQPLNADPPRPKPNTARPARKSVAVEAPELEIKKVANPAPRKKAHQKAIHSSFLQADTSVDGFLLSLGLEKYLITFQAEEVDMTALVHMSDEDLKALGIPM
ncbi:SAM_1 domain-containing protein, partial [Cephalotus follicularis]